MLCNAVRHAAIPIVFVDCRLIAFDLTASSINMRRKSPSESTRGSSVPSGVKRQEPGSSRQRQCYRRYRSDIRQTCVLLIYLTSTCPYPNPLATNKCTFCHASVTSHSHPAQTSLLVGKRQRGQTSRASQPTHHASRQKSRLMRGPFSLVVLLLLRAIHQVMRFSPAKVDYSLGRHASASPRRRYLLACIGKNHPETTHSLASLHCGIECIIDMCLSSCTRPPAPIAA